MLRSLPSRSKTRPGPGGARIASGEAAQPAQTRSSRIAWLGPVLGNPLLVTVVAAVLGGLLIPQLTRQWQDHQKALEIKTDVVGQMSATLSNAIASARFVAAGLVAHASSDPRAEQRAWNDGYREWTTTSASIGARLQAYFGSRIGSDWRSFSDVVTDFVLLSAAPTPGAGRADQAAEIFRYAPELPALRLSRKDWLTLAQTRSGAAFQSAYARLGRALLTRGDEIVRHVLDSNVSGF